MYGVVGCTQVVARGIIAARGAVTRRAVAQRRSRASGLTRPLAEVPKRQCLLNDRFCGTWERSKIRALGGLTIGILN